MGDLLLWRLGLGLDVAALLSDDPADLVPPQYRSVLRTGHAGDHTLPVFHIYEHVADWPFVARRLLTRLAAARAARAEHLLTRDSAVSETGLALVGQGVPAGLVTLDPDGDPELRVALREPFGIHVIVSLERADAAAGAARLLHALLAPHDRAIALLGPDVRAVLGQLAPALAAVNPGTTVTIRLQDLRAAGVHGAASGRDVEVLVEARVANGGDECLVLHSKP